MIDLTALAYDEWIAHNGKVIDRGEGIRILLDRIALVEALHAPDMIMNGVCAECSDFGTDENPEWTGVEYPCRTLRALGGENE